MRATLLCYSLFQHVSAQDDETLLLQTHTRRVSPVHAMLPEMDWLAHSTGSAEAPQKAAVMLEDLSKKVIRGEVEIDDAAKEALNAMLTTLTSSEGIITEAHAEAVELRGTALGNVEACKTAFEAENVVNGAEGTQVESVHSSHQVCRAAQKTVADNKKTKCDAVDNFINALQPPSCAKPNAAGMDNYFATWNAHVDNNWDTWKKLRKECDDASGVDDTKDTECDTIQGNFESEFCTHRLNVYTTCSKYKGCYNAAKSSFEQQIESTNHAAEGRKIEWSAIKKIKCFINVLVADDKENDERQTAYETCQNNVPDTSHLDLDDVILPDDQTCDLSGVAEYPCTDAFKSTRYNGMVGLQECTACPDLPDHIDVDAGHGGCASVKDTPDGWSNTKHATHDGVTYMGLFAHGQKLITKEFKLLGGVTYKWKFVFDTWASVDMEPITLKANDQSFPIQSRIYHTCNNGWSEYPTGWGQKVGGFPNYYKDCFKNIENTFKAPANGIVTVTIGMAIDQGVDNEGWGFHNMEFEPQDCPSPASGGGAGKIEMDGQCASGITFPADGSISSSVGGWGKVCHSSKTFNEDDPIKGISFKIGSGTAHFKGGITGQNCMSSYGCVDFGFTARGHYNCDTPSVYEAGAGRYFGREGGCQNGDWQNQVWTIKINKAGKVEYAVDGKVWYTSTRAVTYPWHFGIDFYTASDPELVDMKYITG